MRDIHTQCYCVEGGSPLKFLMEKVVDEKLLYLQNEVTLHLLKSNDGSTWIQSGQSPLRKNVIRENGLKISRSSYLTNFQITILRSASP